MHGSTFLGLALPKVHIDLLRNDQLMRFRASLDRTRWFLVPLPCQDLAATATLLILAHAKFLSARPNSELVLIVFPGGENLFELHIKTVALDGHG